MRSVALAIAVLIVACGASEERSPDLTEGCEPEAREEGDEEYRVCTSDRDWGPWLQRSEVEACVGPGLYEFTQMLQTGNEELCPPAMPGVVEVLPDGSVAPFELPSSREDTPQDIDPDRCVVSYTRYCEGTPDTSTQYLFDLKNATGAFYYAELSPDASTRLCSYRIELSRERE